MKYLLTAIILLFSPEIRAAEPYTLDNWHLLDGDTIVAERLNLPFGVCLTDVTMRMADYDAWETSFRRTTVNVTNEEIKKGKAAAKDLNELLKNNPFRVLPGDTDKPRDVYGRLLVKIEVNLPEKGWIKIADWMKEKGHCRE